MGIQVLLYECAFGGSPKCCDPQREAGTIIFLGLLRGSEEGEPGIWPGEGFSLVSPLTSCVFSCIQTPQGDCICPHLPGTILVYSYPSDIIVNNTLFMLRSVQL